MNRRSSIYQFDADVGSFVGAYLLAMVLILFSFGLATPWAVVMLQRWKAEHTYLQGRRLVFVGDGGELFGMYIVWWLLSLVTCGIYWFFAIPKMHKWIAENTDVDPRQLGPPPELLVEAGMMPGHGPGAYGPPGYGPVPVGDESSGGYHPAPSGYPPAPPAPPTALPPTSNPTSGPGRPWQP